MLSLVNVKKTFRAADIETTAVNCLTLRVQQGEFLSIMGPSGCGKSTLLNIIGLLDDIDEGQYWFLDEEISKQKERQLSNTRRQNIGFIFQSFNLIDEMSVYDNIELPLLYQGVPAGARKQRVEELLDRVGIYHRKQHMPQQLSGGQQQRVAVARALVNNPKLILADEPTGNLDSKSGVDVLNLLTKMNEELKTTVIMVTHSSQHAENAHRILHMLDGEIKEEQILRRHLDHV
jgi:putative ABC transport system ATP-binding protein